MLIIRLALPADQNAIWDIVRQVIATGDTYVFDPTSSREKMLAYWCGPDKHTYVATLNDQIVGTFFIKDNQPDLGSHIANAGYMTAPAAAGKGIGKTMGSFHWQKQNDSATGLCSSTLSSKATNALSGCGRSWDSTSSEKYLTPSITGKTA